MCRMPCSIRSLEPRQGGAAGGLAANPPSQTARADGTGVERRDCGLNAGRTQHEHRKFLSPRMLELLAYHRTVGAGWRHGLSELRGGLMARMERRSGRDGRARQANSIEPRKSDGWLTVSYIAARTLPRMEPRVQRSPLPRNSGDLEDSRCQPIVSILKN